MAEDGRLPSIWDTFSHTPGTRRRTATPATSPATTTTGCAEDVALMADLGLQAYRFSVSWPRVVPAGSGAVNQAGPRLLLAAGRRAARARHRPAAHALPLGPAAGRWRTPAAGRNRDTAERFAEYAAAVGAGAGRPGARPSPRSTSRGARPSSATPAACTRPGATDNAAALARRAPPQPGARSGRDGAAVGRCPRRRQIVGHAQPRPGPAGRPTRPPTWTPPRHVDGLANRIFLDPMLRGSYPSDVLRRPTPRHRLVVRPRRRHGRLINAPLDCSASTTTRRPRSPPRRPSCATRSAGRWSNDPTGTEGPSTYPGTDLALSIPQDGPYTAMGWRIEPASLTELLLRVHRDYPGCR